MYTGETILPFGRYSGRMLKDIRKGYLFNIYKCPKSHKPNLTQEIWDELKPYLESCIMEWDPGFIKLYKNEFLTTAEKEEKEKVKCPEKVFTPPTPSIIDFPCTKVAYPNEKEAKKTIRSIGKDEQKRKKSPIRTYECEKCGGWHLTSISREEWLGSPKNAN